MKLTILVNSEVNYLLPISRTHAEDNMQLYTCVYNGTLGENLSQNRFHFRMKDVPSVHENDIICITASLITDAKAFSLKVSFVKRSESLNTGITEAIGTILQCSHACLYQTDGPVAN